jgi:EAL domain-containing protein (putative c-di-GMP-specific phosphodiesterase class I)
MFKRVREISGQSAETTDWPAALHQVFSEPWRVRPAFQPIVDLERRAVWGFQVLARFISTQRAAPPEARSARASVWAARYRRWPRP